MVRMVMAGLVLAVLSGCGLQDDAQSSEGRKEATSDFAKPQQQRQGQASHPGELVVPAGLRLSSLSYVKAARSWTDRLATLTIPERKKLESLNARYHGALEFNDAEEQRKLIAAGVPMPEEWLAASRMSDGELERLAKARSPKGSMFFADRQLDRYLEARQRLEGTGIDVALHPDVLNSQAQAFVYANQALALTRSPFAAYLYGAVGARIYGDPAYLAAGISVAGALGDKRAGAIAHQFVQQQQAANAPPLSFESVASIETMMWREVHRYRPL